MELLVCIAIVGLLIGLVVPLLAEARGRAVQTVVSANLRTAGACFVQYHARYDGVNPWVEANTPLLVSSPGEPQTTISTNNLFVLSQWWPALFHEVAPWEGHYRTWVHRETNPDGVVPWRTPGGSTVSPVFAYARSLQARPGVWPAAPSTGSAPEFRATRAAEVAFPSSKALLFDSDRSYLRRPGRASDPRGVLAFDGPLGCASIRMRRPRSRTPSRRPPPRRITKPCWASSAGTSDALTAPFGLRGRAVADGFP